MAREANISKATLEKHTASQNQGRHTSGPGPPPHLTHLTCLLGPWQGPAGTPKEHTEDSPANLELWAPDVRAAVLDFEAKTQLGFGASGKANNKTMSVWHLDIQQGKGLPKANYQPLCDLTRPSVATLREQLDFLNHYADLRQDRATEILVQLAPPWSFLGSIAFLRDGRSKWTQEILMVAWRLAQFVHFRAKHALACRRPIEFSAQVQPMIPTPTHGTLPSGHATEAFMLATVLLENMTSC